MQPHHVPVSLFPPQVWAALQRISLMAPLGADILLHSFCLQSDPCSLPLLSWRVPQRPCWDLLSVSSPLITSQRSLEFMEIVQLSFPPVLSSAFRVSLFFSINKAPRTPTSCASHLWVSILPAFSQIIFSIFTSFLEFVLLIQCLSH